ncbi:colistin resistant protein CrrC [Raoultella terrigena]|uniref:colistin resistant protein CrrC n=1 Tax=Raoultella terrigena TaxID=577 RepID=UPI001F51A86F
MNIIKNVCLQKIIDSILFILTSWGMLYAWLILIHHVEERVTTTILSSPFIYVCIAVSVLLFIKQKQAGALKDLSIVTFWLAVIFVYSAVVFNLLLNITPEIADILFYYEFFLVIFFCGSPMFLLIRLI